jgi:hypothetical protein
LTPSRPIGTAAVSSVSASPLRRGLLSLFGSRQSQSPSPAGGSTSPMAADAGLRSAHSDGHGVDGASGSSVPGAVEMTSLSDVMEGLASRRGVMTSRSDGDGAAGVQASGGVELDAERARAARERLRSALTVERRDGRQPCRSVQGGNGAGGDSDGTAGSPAGVIDERAAPASNVGLDRSRELSASLAVFASPRPGQSSRSNRAASRVSSRLTPSRPVGTAAVSSVSASPLRRGVMSLFGSRGSQSPSPAGGSTSPVGASSGALTQDRDAAMVGGAVVRSAQVDSGGVDPAGAAVLVPSPVLGVERLIVPDAGGGIVSMARDDGAAAVARSGVAAANVAASGSVDLDAERVRAARERLHHAMTVERSEGGSGQRARLSVSGSHGGAGSGAGGGDGTGSNSSGVIDEDSSSRGVSPVSDVGADRARKLSTSLAVFASPRPGQSSRSNRTGSASPAGAAGTAAVSSVSASPLRRGLMSLFGSRGSVAPAGGSDSESPVDGSGAAAQGTDAAMVGSAVARSAQVDIGGVDRGGGVTSGAAHALHVTSSPAVVEANPSRRHGWVSTSGGDGAAAHGGVGVVASGSVDLDAERVRVAHERLRRALAVEPADPSAMYNPNSVNAAPASNVGLDRSRELSASLAVFASPRPGQSSRSNRAASRVSSRLTPSRPVGTAAVSASPLRRGVASLFGSRGSQSPSPAGGSASPMAGDAGVRSAHGGAGAAMPGAFEMPSWIASRVSSVTPGPMLDVDGFVIDEPSTAL